MIYYGNEFYHHGILGQRWGKRNGPPYPLDAGDHSKAEEKAGWRKSLGENIKTAVKNKAREVITRGGPSRDGINDKTKPKRPDIWPDQKHEEERVRNRIDGVASLSGGKSKINLDNIKNIQLTDKQKKAIIIGGAVAAVAAVAVIGGIYLHRSGVLQRVRVGEAAANNVLGRNIGNTPVNDILGNANNTQANDILKNAQNTSFESVKGNGQPIKSRPLETASEISKMAETLNPTKGQGNCASCSTAGVMNIIGFPNARAKPDLPKDPDGSQPGYNVKEIVKCFKGSKLEDPWDLYEPSGRDKGFAQFEKAILKHGNGSAGILSTANFKIDPDTGKRMINENGESKITNGHAIFWKVIDNKVHYFEGQKQLKEGTIQMGDHNEYFDFYNTTWIHRDPNLAQFACLTNNTGIDFDTLQEKFIEFI